MDLDDELAKDGRPRDGGRERRDRRRPRHDLAPSVETVLALALREAVTNVVRHARASSCVISLNGSPGEVVLEVADDGIGSGEPEGSGLRGMRERVMAAGGNVERSGPPGTRLRVRVPVGSA